VKIRVVTQYGPRESATRVRVLHWLQRAGFDAEVLRYLGTGHLGPRVLLRSPGAVARAEVGLRRAALRRTDVVVMQRQASPFSRGGIEERLLRGARHSVVDVDDAVQWNWRSGLTGLVRRPTAFLRAVRAADVTIAGNDLLADWASDQCREVVTIPTCVEPGDYDPKTDHRLASQPRLGWIGSPATEKYLRMIESPLLDLHRRTGAMLVVVSAGDASLGQLDAMVRRVPWSVGTTRDLGSLMDIGVMPLDDSLWSRSKSGYKLLQYAAAGLPAVASPTGVNTDIAGALGFPTATGAEEWRSALARLIEAAADERARMGGAARVAVGERYSYEAWAPVWWHAVTPRS
jgi:hypothetical protein